MGKIKCKNCDREVEENSLYCNNCGAKLNNNDESIRTNINIEKQEKHILAWIVSVFTMFLGLVLFPSPHSIVIIIAGIFICPLFIRFIKNKYNQNIKKSVQVLVWIILMIFSIAVTDTSKTQTENTNNNIENSDVKEKSNIAKEDEKVETEEEKALRIAKEKEEAEKLKLQEETKFKESCQSYNYKDIARNPNSYISKNVVFTGKVIQVSENSTLFSNSKNVQIRLAVTKGEYGIYDDYVYCSYTYKTNEPKILEDDIITIYGTCKGDYTYTSVLGANVTLPSIDIKYYTQN